MMVQQVGSVQPYVFPGSPYPLSTHICGQLKPKPTWLIWILGKCYFPLHPELQQLAGVHLAPNFPDDPSAAGLLWGGWNLPAMGIRSSPYECVQAITLAEEIILGDPTNPNNIFGWDLIRLNLPGSDEYDPSLPRVSKIRSSDGRLAADLFIFVDNIRTRGKDQLTAWLASRRAASTLSYLGIQDASQKRRDSSKHPGAWAGSVVRSDKGGVHQLISDEKWEKTKALLLETKEMLAKNPS
jgi:hypothetical protein